MPTTVKRTTAYVEITDQCNLNCVHCYIDARKKRQKPASKDAFLKVLEYLAEKGFRNVWVSGGEPLLHTELDGILASLYRMKYRIGISTNATLMNPAFLERNAGVISAYQVSLEGAQKYNDSIRGDGNFDVVLRGLALLQKRRSYFGIQVSNTCLENVAACVRIARAYEASWLRVASDLHTCWSVSDALVRSLAELRRRNMRHFDLVSDAIGPDALDRETIALMLVVRSNCSFSYWPTSTRSFDSLDSCINESERIEEIIWNRMLSERSQVYHFSVTNRMNAAIQDIENE